jgi:hypothetical protein
MTMTSLDFDKLLSEIRSARERNDFATLLNLLIAAPDERAEDVAAVYPLAYEVWEMVLLLETEGVHSFAVEMERRFGARAGEQGLPAGFAPVLGDVLHKALLAAKEEDPFGTSLALECGADDQVMVVSDDEHLFCGEESAEGDFTPGLDGLWPQLDAAIYDAEAHGGRGEARAYVGGDKAAEIGLPGQQISPVHHALVDSDGATTLYVFPTLAGWVVWSA